MELKLAKDNLAIKEVKNPFINRTKESGILTMDGMTQSNETGEIEMLDQLIQFGIVTHVGPDCKTVKIGDGVYFDRRVLKPIPFHSPIWSFNVGNVIAYVESTNNNIEKLVEEKYQEELTEQRKTALAFQNDLRNKGKAFIN